MVSELERGWSCEINLCNGSLGFTFSYKDVLCIFTINQYICVLCLAGDGGRSRRGVLKVRAGLDLDFSVGATSAKQPHEPLSWK